MARHIASQQLDSSIVRDYIYVNLQETSDRSYTASSQFDFSKLDSSGGELQCSLPLDGEQVKIFNRFKEIILENEKLRTSMASNTKVLKEHVNGVKALKENHKNELDELKNRLAGKTEQNTKLQEKLDSMSRSMSGDLVTLGQLATCHEKLRDFVVSFRDVFKKFQESFEQETIPSLTSMKDQLTKIPEHYEHLRSFMEQSCKSLQDQFKPIEEHFKPIEEHNEQFLSFMTQMKRQCSEVEQQSVTSSQLTKQLTSKSLENRNLKERLVLMLEREKKAAGIAHDLENTKNALHAAKQEISTLKAEVSLLNEQKSVEVLTVATNQSQVIISELRKKVEDEDKESQKLKLLLREKDNELAELSTKFEEVYEDNDCLKENVKVLQMEINDLKKRIDLDKIKQQVKNESWDPRDLACLQNMLETEEGKVSKLMLQIEGLENENTAQRQQIQELQGILEQEKLVAAPVKERGAKKEFLLKQIADLERRIQLLQRSESSNLDQINNLMKTDELARTKIMRLEQCHSDLRRQIEEKDKLLADATNLSRDEQLRELQEMQKEAAEKLHNFTIKTGQLEKAVQALTQDKVDLQKNVQFLLGENSEVDQRLQSLVNRDDLGREELKQVHERYQALEIEYAEKHAEIEQLYAISEEKDSQIVELTTQLQTLQHEHETCAMNNKELRGKLEMLLLASDKLKRDYENLWIKFQTKVKDCQMLQEVGDKNQAELVAARDLLANKEVEINDLKAALATQLKAVAQQKEECGLYFFQADTYKHDFEAERASKMILHEELMKTREKIQELQLENTRLTEDLDHYSNGQLEAWRQRHGGPPSLSKYQWSSGPPSVPPQPGLYQFGNRGMYDQDMLTRDDGRRGEFSDPVVYGRGPGSRLPGRSQGTGRAGPEEPEALGRQCPKCKVLLPDLDSLQIHVMECLTD